MPDLQKAISAVEWGIRVCVCTESIGATLSKTDLQNILELLKGKAVKPIRIENSPNKYFDNYRCPSCNGELVFGQAYCSDCGGKVKWDG